MVKSSGPPFVSKGESGRIINELLDFIEIHGHEEDCRPFGEWTCGQQGLLDKYRPKRRKKKDIRKMEEYHRYLDNRRFKNDRSG